MSRDTCIDGVKGVAITLMVYGHVTHVGSLAGFQKDVVGWIYTFHMPIFLMLSGYFFGGVVSPREAFRKIFRKLMIPYLIFISVYLFGLFFASCVGANANNAPPSSLLDAIQIVLLRPRGAYWFIHSLLIMQSVFIFGAWIQSLLSLREVDLWIIFVGGLCLLAISGLLREDVVFFFCVGMLFRKALSRLPGSLVLGGILCAVVIRVGHFELLTRMGPDRVIWCLGVLSFLSGAFSAGVVPASGAFSWLGRNTMPILMLHALFLVALKSSSPLFVSIDGSGVLNSLISTIAAMLGSIMCARIFDRVGLSSALFGTPVLYSPRLQRG